ncbi:hypothetical protein HNP46_000381 [Pseudomonas nitritireducens]|uniref:Uncharacterized protein n=1 Tax=Pseudomonas nitroreducens TaxID=46680 RepID=A0A7W7KFK9_PSENT|nr:hypothetical protein [Pseudomonas nitritireducens]MBB4861570.1 hypothetical protein [Pseudomonas nitritireducens]
MKYTGVDVLKDAAVQLSEQTRGQHSPFAFLEALTEPSPHSSKPAGNCGPMELAEQWLDFARKGQLVTFIKHAKLAGLNLYEEATVWLAIDELMTLQVIPFCSTEHWLNAAKQFQGPLPINNTLYDWLQAARAGKLEVRKEFDEHGLHLYPKAKT